MSERESGSVDSDEHGEGRRTCYGVLVSRVVEGLTSSRLRARQDALRCLRADHPRCFDTIILYINLAAA